MEERNYTKGLLEALLFLSSDPIKLSALAKSCGIEKTEARELLDELILDYQEREGGFLLREIAGGYQFITNQKYSEILSHIFKDKKRETLSRGTLDTLAIIAYKQPITLTELDEIRGVSSRAMVASLMSKKLVKAVGQKEVPGRPTLYGTTNEFLLHFGLSKLTDLPTPVEVKELKFEDFTPESIIVTDETEMNPDFDLDSLPEELKEENLNE
ncbi:transcriptional regulator [Leptospira ellinghausenii]|uniref:Transcriptional regulator n=1 Tax=Leptospira ellinghausenii TaxID=1917822 RepID=A0A2P2DAJ0_9LEPT|nr:SMC-Scp complex subunit ScpB [Leptospira ellinghausenii]GBF41662.1 transcriptional regulator [Leptospira ellinghausenii]